MEQWYSSGGQPFMLVLGAVLPHRGNPDRHLLWLICLLLTSFNLTSNNQEYPFKNLVSKFNFICYYH